MHGLVDPVYCRGKRMQALTVFLAFVAVLALIGGAAWLVCRFAGNRLGADPNRGRMPRLAVIDAAAVDSRRRLVLVRRDNIEHLLVVGGPAHNVVGPKIVRALPPRGPIEQRPRGAAQPTPPPPAAPGGAGREQNPRERGQPLGSRAPRAGGGGAGATGGRTAGGAGAATEPWRTTPQRAADGAAGNCAFAKERF